MDKTIGLTKLAQLFQNTYSLAPKNYGGAAQGGLVKAQNIKNVGQGYQFNNEILNADFYANQKAVGPMKQITGTFIGENEKAA